MGGTTKSRKGYQLGSGSQRSIRSGAAFAVPVGPAGFFYSGTVPLIFGSFTDTFAETVTEPAKRIR